MALAVRPPAVLITEVVFAERLKFRDGSTRESDSSQETVCMF